MVVKDEVDVVSDVLAGARSWASSIWVLDNGSTDGTWEVLRRVAASSNVVRLVGRDERPFHDGLRSELFQEAKRVAAAGDWWLRLDADEFHVVDPRAVLATPTALSDAVLGNMYFFHLVEEDAAAIEADCPGWSQRPLTERLRWYRNDWAELRAVRHHRNLVWDGTPWPTGSFRYSRAALQIRHYQYRSPAQIEVRLRSRLDLPEFVHERARQVEAARGEATSWRQVVVPSGGLDYDDGVAPLVARFNHETHWWRRGRSQAGWILRNVRRDLSRNFA